jgi:signal transduction histidine kinase
MKAIISPLNSLTERIKDYATAEATALKDDPMDYLEQISVKMKNELDSLRRRISAMQKLRESLSKSVTTNDLIRAVADELNSSPDIDAGLVLLVNPGKALATLYPLFPKEQFSKREFIFGEGGLSLNRLQIESSVYREQLSDSRNLNEAEKFFMEKGYQSSFTAAVVNEGTFFGLISVASKGQGGLSKENFSFIENIASLMGLKLAYMQLCSDFKQKREELVEFKHVGREKIDQQIAELKATYSQTVQHGKMASLGLLSAGIAHELNNPIGGILGYTQLILNKLRKSTVTNEDIENSIKYLELMEKDSKRCQWIVTNLLNFARKPLDERKAIDIKDVISNTIGMMEYQLTKNHIKVSVDLPPEGLKKVKGNANELQQVFTNLIQNAQDAMPDGGEVTIVGRNKSDTNYGVSLGYIELLFKDAGCGIAKEDLSKIFDPFFTSKIGQSGTGLGLSISYTIVSSHGGFISVESQEGEGTTFIVTLPAISEPMT